MKHILVADDDRQMARTLCAILRKRGWQTTEAHSGEEAVELAGTRHFTVVLMDVRMPGLNGVEAFRKIRVAQPRTPVILMTAYAAPELLAEAENEGVLRILPKPIPWGTLTELLEHIAGTSGSVLVVDDDPEFLNTLTNILKAAGHNVRKAQSLSDAVTLLDENAPQVVVLDLLLDDGPPRDSILAIRTLSPAAALILCSGHPALLDATVSDLPSGWIYASLTKPFGPDRLMELLDAVDHN
jgi:two-component system response regulator HydG